MIFDEAQKRTSFDFAELSESALSLQQSSWRIARRHETCVTLAEAGHAHLVWLNLGLSLLAGFAAVVLGHWLGEVL